MGIALSSFAGALVPELLSESRLARLLDRTGMELVRAFRAGKLRPDYFCGKQRLYRRSRVEEIEQEILTKPTP